MWCESAAADFIYPDADGIAYDRSVTKQMLGTAVAAGVAMIGLAALLLLSSPDGDGERATLEESVLQLSDLPRGYSLGDDAGCGMLTPEGRPPDLGAVLGRTFPEACHNQLERFDGVQPVVIESVAIELGTAAAAVRVMGSCPPSDDTSSARLWTRRLSPTTSVTRLP